MTIKAPTKSVSTSYRRSSASSIEAPCEDLSVTAARRDTAMTLRLGLGVVVAVILILTGATHAAVTIDFAADRGAVSSRYNGFHLGVTDNDPPDSVILPLKPKFIGRAIVSYHRALALGAVSENGIGFSAQSQLDGVYPGDSGSYTAWEAFVTNNVNSLIGFGFTTNIQWDIWNEPDNPEFWQRSQAQFFETYRRAVRIVRALMPGSKIIGPGIAVYNQTYLQDFLLFAKANNVLPDTLAWHEVSQAGGCCSAPQQAYIGADFLTRVATMRAFMVANGISITDIEIDEMFAPSYYLKPATFVVSAANLQRAGILQAGRACWMESSGYGNCMGNNSGGSAAGVVTPPPSYQPRSAWWAMKAYADLAGRYVDLTADASFDGLASWDATTGSIRLALGNVGGSATTEIRLVNLGRITAAATSPTMP
jgi:hypothetical protein